MNTNISLFQEIMDTFIRLQISHQVFLQMHTVIVKGRERRYLIIVVFRCIKYAHVFLHLLMSFRELEEQIGFIQLG